MALQSPLSFLLVGETGAQHGLYKQLVQVLVAVVMFSLMALSLISWLP